MSDSSPGLDLVVETMGPESTILAENGRHRDFRRIGNSYRGAAQNAIERVVAEVIATRQPVVNDVGQPASSIIGATIAGAPVIGLDNPVAAVCLGPTRQSAEDAAAGIAVWEWELLSDLPPRLRVDNRFLDLATTHPDFRDRTIFGPVDFFRSVVRLRDVVQVWTTVRTAEVGDRSGGWFVVRADHSTTARLVHYAQRCVATDAGPRLRGVCRELTDTADSANLPVDMVETELARTFLGLSEMFGVVGDVAYPNAPCIIKWLTNAVPGIGHGVSTGQTPAIHPDDLPNVIQWIYEARKAPVSNHVRLRRGAGGWLRVRFHAQILDPSAFPTLGLAVIYPDSIDAVDVPEESARPS